jgi:2-polyprenyl-3-methyl-5-hydroxy-6-metoxy-1,4-benzoquinol methylase
VANPARHRDYSRKTPATGDPRFGPRAFPMSKNSYAKRILWRLLRLIGAEKYSWDLQYRSGHWDSLSVSSRTISLINDLSDGSKIIEFACGDGRLRSKIKQNSFLSYQGYDISQVAIDRARERVRISGLQNVKFDCLSMQSWIGDNDVDLFIIDEAIYYLENYELKTFFDKIFKSMSKRGSLIITIHSRTKHNSTIESIKSILKEVIELNFDSRVYLLYIRDDNLKKNIFKSFFI